MTTSEMGASGADAALDGVATRGGRRRDDSGGVAAASLRGVGKSFGGTGALDDVSLELRAGRGAGAARRERRRQEHLRQAAGRGLPARRRARSCSTAGRSTCARRSTRSATASPSCTSIPACSRDLDVAENIFIGQHAARPLAPASTAQPMRREAARLLERWSASTCRPETAAGPAAHLRAAAGRDRPGALARGAAC